ncbi:MAG TPA: TonB family protein [Pyrinomonadaceae bacterium]|nr:TonB family protein [Pyrinomonadaceae bacterium]
MMDGPMAQPPKKSGCGKVILILAIILLLIGGGIAAAIYFGYQKLESTLKSSEAYSVALEKLKENEEVRNELGEIRATGFPLGAFDQKADGTGGAAFMMSVQGEKANGRYEVVLKRTDHVWRLIKGTLRTDGGKVISVADEFGTSDDVDTPDININDNSSELPTPENLKAGKIVSGGVLNGKAISLPKPPYPPLAKQVNASGTVVVQVTVDEEGKVISATAVSGHPLLRAPAVSAARSAKFSPTLLSGRPVKVSGVITYNFVAE